MGQSAYPPVTLKNHILMFLCKKVQSTLVMSTSVSSKRISGPCFNTEIENQVTKYCRKEEKLLLGSNFSPFPQYFQYIFLIKGVKLHGHL